MHPKINKNNEEKNKQTDSTKKQHELFESDMLQFLDHQLKSNIRIGATASSFAFLFKLGQAIIERDS